jgi:hypothetical protein
MSRHLRDDGVRDAFHKQDGRCVMPEVVNPQILNLRQSANPPEPLPQIPDTNYNNRFQPSSFEIPTLMKINYQYYADGKVRYS